MTSAIQTALRILALELERTTPYDDVREACKALVRAIDDENTPAPDKSPVFGERLFAPSKRKKKE